MARKRGPLVTRQLLLESREAAMNAVQTFNNPLTTFKAETFIVLMNIAWMYMLHAYYRKTGIEYRYHHKGPVRRRFEKTKSGGFRYWSLTDCLGEPTCPLDQPSKLNLTFLIGLRQEIEHHRAAGSDNMFSARYLACCLNYERYICELFGERFSLGDTAALTLQFRDLTSVQRPPEATQPLPSNVAKYVQDFESGLDDNVFSSPHFSYRMLFVPKVVGKRGQADEVIEFVKPDSELGQIVNENYSKVMLKEVERPKHLAGEIVKVMQSEGYVRFNMYNHTQLWKNLDAKNPGKGYGVLVAKTWYWYDRWIDEVRKHCQDNIDRYAEPRIELAS